MTDTNSPIPEVRDDSPEVGGTPSSRPIHKRKHYVVDRTAQLRFALHLTGLLLIGGLLELGFAYALWNLRGSLTTDVSAILSDPLLNLMPWLYVLLVLAVNVLVFIVLGMLYYHRIAGPSVNIVRSLQRIAEGDLRTRVRLRKGDHLGGIAAATDNLADEWNALVVQLREHVEALKRLEGPVDQQTLDEHVDAIETSLAGFQTKP